MKKYILIFHLSLLSPNVSAELSSYEELVIDVAENANISRPLAENVIDLTFEEIRNRLKENKGTSIPDFGRFYVQEKYQKIGEGEFSSKKSVLTPRFSMSPELKKKVGGSK